MAKHKNPLEKELLIRMYLSDTSIKLSDFCKKQNEKYIAYRCDNMVLLVCTLNVELILDKCVGLPKFAVYVVFLM